MGPNSLAAGMREIDGVALHGEENIEALDHKDVPFRVACSTRTCSVVDSGI